MLVIILLIVLALFVDIKPFVPSKAQKAQAKAQYAAEQARRASINAEIERGRRERGY